jgi:hypothetical protein
VNVLIRGLRAPRKLITGGLGPYLIAGPRPEPRGALDATAPRPDPFRALDAAAGPDPYRALPVVEVFVPHAGALLLAGRGYLLLAGGGRLTLA